jgi:hypothetical protein
MLSSPASFRLSQFSELPAFARPRKNGRIADAGLTPRRPAFAASDYGQAFAYATSTPPPLNSRVLATPPADIFIRFRHEDADADYWLSDIFMPLAFHY